MLLEREGQHSMQASAQTNQNASHSLFMAKARTVEKKNFKNFNFKVNSRSLTDGQELAKRNAWRLRLKSWRISRV